MLSSNFMQKTVQFLIISDFVTVIAIVYATISSLVDS